VEFKGVPIIVERIGADGDIAKARRLYLEMDDLDGKTVITNTTTSANLEFLRERGVSTVITRIL